MSRSLRWLLITLFLLIGFGLRINGLGAMNDATLYDEAAYGLDALSLIDNPQLTPFFERNNGRESLWMYVTAPALAIWGAQPFSLRIMAAFVGLLTLAVAYRLGREILGKQGAIWVLAALAVFYWPVHLSHIGFRAALYPLLAMTSLAALLHAYRTNRRWWLAGLLLGLLLYTYIAARVWVGLGLLLLALWLLMSPSRRRGALPALLIALIVMLPLGLYLLNRSVPEDRTAQVAIGSLDDLANNVAAWAGAWLYEGDFYQTHNLPNRPIFDLPTAIMALLGLLGMWRGVRRRWHLAVLLIAFVGALAPALLSIDNPHMLRAYGAVVPLAVLLGTGLFWLVRRSPRWGTLLAIGLLSWAGINSYIDFRHVADTWNDFLPGEYQIQHAVDYLAEHPPEIGQTVAVMGFPNEHPVLDFLTYGQTDARWLQFQPGYCTVYDASAPMLAVALPPDMDFQQQRLDQWGALESVHADRFTIWQVTLDEAVLSVPKVTFGDDVQLAALDMPTSAQAGQTLIVTLALRADSALGVDFNGFIQLWGTPSPLDGGPLWSQQDLRLCEPFPSSQWKPQDLIVQTWELKLPQEIPGGSYQIMAGVYDARTGVRLLYNADQDIVTLGEVAISP